MFQNNLNLLTLFYVEHRNISQKSNFISNLSSEYQVRAPVISTGDFSLTPQSNLREIIAYKYSAYKKVILSNYVKY